MSPVIISFIGLDNASIHAGNMIDDTRYDSVQRLIDTKGESYVK